MKPGLVFLLVCLSVFLLEFVECQQDEKVTKNVAKNKRQHVGKKVKAAATKKTKGKPKAKKVKVPAKIFIMTQLLEEGRFQKPSDTVVLSVGKRLVLRCKGKHISWAYPSYLDEEDGGRFSITHRKRHSQLVVVNSTGADTGEYSCWALDCDTETCRKEDSKTGSTYVFFTDPRELFVPANDYYEAVQLRTDRPTRLPCQVTNPLAKVSLHREFPPEVIPVDGKLITFDVKKGFIIHKALPLFAGTVYCVASYRGLLQSSTKYLLIFTNYPSAPPSAKITASSSSVPVGANFNVTCTVLGEIDIEVDFTWEFPGQELGRPTYTRESQESVYMDGQIRQLSQSVLLVDEGRPVDDGLYKCVAQNLQGKTTVSTHVNVLPHTSPGQT
ncbi:platelet-derived growth factor receptor-like protein [Carcharodon carcharias]|uniref:platelet-derived growth factor receptor-like protein n=1 Tax=Carcharodon carcharias TaxID=13397 RepID=UPI001B7EAD79|nr:platelet-derived growth factor receptor-like protein [Carcharodon carcharias]